MQRAFVAVSDFTAIPGETDPQIGGPRLLHVLPHYKNSGATRTRNGYAWSNHYWSNGPIPSDFTFPNLDKDGKVVSPACSGSILIPPQNITLGVPYDPDIDTLATIKAGRKHAYMYGWIKYQDVFSSAWYVTRYCYEIASVELVGTRQVGDDATASNGKSYILPLSPCPDYPHYACVDETCEYRNDENCPN